MSDRGSARRRPARRGRAPEQGFESWSKGPNAASGRIAQGMVVPHFVPGFRLTPQARVFVVGPWFARKLEQALTGAGVRVTSRDLQAALREVRENPKRGHLNKYNPLAVAQELDWAAGQDFPREGLMPAGDALVDPFLHERAAHGGAEALMRRRREIAAYFARAFAADLVVIVLGNIETWFDRRTKLALNNPPLQRVFDTDPERFSLRRLETGEVSASLKRIVQRLKGQNAKQKVILTVSPMPLERTYGPEDVIVANMAGKSTLHAAATECAGAHPQVDYFPAYEAVMTSDPARAWNEDRRTVRDEMVAAITRSFVDRYGLFLAADSQTVGRA